MPLSDIGFDEQDRNLFQVPDARLRADALKHSLLPRLHAVMHETIDLIRQIYGVEVLEDSIISYYPHFRPKRGRELELLYEQAFVGLGGKRVKNKWHGMERYDGRPVQVLPFRLAFYLSEAGMGILLENHWLKGLTDASYGKLFAFHHRHEAMVTRLCFAATMRPQIWWGEHTRPLEPLSQHYRYMEAEGLYDNHFFSSTSGYPITPQHLDELVLNYALFYPVYDSYLRIAKGEPENFDGLIAKANDWLEAQAEQGEKEGKPVGRDSALLQAASTAAAQRARVMPALRWQVFQRDQWKCCACGRSSHHGVILHVDHIVPRSKGGADALDNFQTLCAECNSGKSNRDTTNLRLI